MLADAIRSETYRLSKNRTAVFWSVLFAPLLFILGGVAFHLLTRAKTAAIAGQVAMPSSLTLQPVNLADALHFSANHGANGAVLVFMTIAAATVYAGDYRWETWRLISARNSRPWLLLGKVGVMKLLAAAAMLAMLVASFIFFLSQAIVTGRTISFDLAQFDLGRFLLIWLLSYIRIVQYGLVALLAGVVSRSLLAALFVPIALGFAQGLLGGPFMPILGLSPQDWTAQLLFPGLAYDTLKAVVEGGLAEPPPGVGFKAAISLLLWCIVPVFGAVAWFNRQDLSKE